MAMKTVQITMDDELVERVDERAKRLGATRSGFVRQALRVALARHEKAEHEERQKAGYRRIPPTPQEFAIPDEDHALGRGRLERWVMRRDEIRWYRFAPPNERGLVLVLS